jgi:hypothetical protein
LFVFLTAFSVFNLVAAFGAAGAGMRLSGEEGRKGWASRRLYTIALILAWGLAVLGVAATGLAWTLAPGAPHFALVVLVPIGWILVMGLAFAIVDFAEDGVFDFGRGPGRR